MSKNREATGARSWWRILFADHPNATAKTPDTYVESETGNTKTRKVYCRLCLIADIQQIEKEDLYAVDQGRLNIIRDEVAITAYCKFVPTIQQGQCLL